MIKSYLPFPIKANNSMVAAEMDLYGYFKRVVFMGESDLFFYGIGIMVVAALFPWKALRKRLNIIFIIGCYILYISSEIISTFALGNFSLQFGLLFLGGISFSIATGRLIKYCF